MRKRKRIHERIVSEGEGAKFNRLFAALVDLLVARKRLLASREYAELRISKQASRARVGDFAGARVPRRGPVVSKEGSRWKRRQCFQCFQCFQADLS